MIQAEGECLRRFAPATERNREPIAQVLARYLQPGHQVLEIGAGSGQHAAFFSRRFPDVGWFPTDRKDNLPSVAAWCEEGGDNLKPPLELDVTDRWPDAHFDVVFSANTAHIMSWAEVKAMVAGVASVLLPGGHFLLYGPFHRGGEPTSQSNAAFDRQLQTQAPHMGVRDLEAMDELAQRHALRRVARIDMPANNMTLAYQSRSTSP